MLKIRIRNFRYRHEVYRKCKYTIRLEELVEKQKEGKIRVWNRRETRIIQKNEKKPFLMKNGFVFQNREKVILYKMTKVIFAFFHPYYTTFVRFITFKQWMHVQFFWGNTKAFLGGSSGFIDFYRHFFSWRCLRVFMVCCVVLWCGVLSFLIVFVLSCGIFLSVLTFPFVVVFISPFTILIYIAVYSFTSVLSNIFDSSYLVLSLQLVQHELHGAAFSTNKTTNKAYKQDT